MSAGHVHFMLACRHHKNMAACKTVFPPQAWLKRSGLAAISIALLAGTALADVPGKVVRVLDGDTIEVLQDDDTQVRIRLAGTMRLKRGSPGGSVRASMRSSRWT